MIQNVVYHWGSNFLTTQGSSGEQVSDGAVWWRCVNGTDELGDQSNDADQTETDPHQKIGRQTGCQTVHLSKKRKGRQADRRLYTDRDRQVHIWHNRLTLRKSFAASKMIPKQQCVDVYYDQSKPYADLLCRLQFLT